MKRKLSMLLTGALLLLSVLLMIVGCGGSMVKFTFDPNGGTMEQTVYEAEEGETFTMPTPVREGYSFEGWYTDSSLSGEAAPAAVTAEQDMTYYAKWEQLYPVNFELGGGTLSGGPLYLKAGANIKTAVGELVPQLADHQFGEWLLNGNPLSDSAVMPASSVTLTAHYKVLCTVETFLQKLGGDGYEQGKTVSEYAYEGVEYTPVYTEEGFTLSTAAHEDAIGSKKVSSTPSENLFRLYFDRNSYNVMFLADYPFETENRGDNRSFNYPYKTELEAPNYFNAEAEGRGYIFLGWATSHGGDVVYHVDSIGGKLYGGNGETAKGDPITVQGEMILYGVWAKGYMDLFRGRDFIYRFPEEPKKVYLQREEFFFEGEYNEGAQEFYFYDAQSDIILQGSFVDDGVFAYSSSSRADLAPAFYSADRAENPVDESRRLYFDAYNGVTYHNNEDQSTSEGTYTLDDAGCLVVTYTSGEMSGETHIYRVGTYTDNTGARSIFMERNEEEYDYGTLSFSFTSADGRVYTYNPPLMNLTLDGFGTCTLVNTSGTAEYYYYEKSEAVSEKGEPIYNILYADRTLYGSVCIGEEGGVYWLYDADHARLYPVNNSAKMTLRLDGTRYGVYTDESGTVYEGIYATASTQLKYSASADSELVYLFTTAPQQKVFLFRLTPFELPGMGVLAYDAKLLSDSYGEFLYSDEDSIYYTPFIVFGEDGADTVSLYGYTREGTHILVSTGSYTFDENTLLYHYTAETFADLKGTEIYTDRIDPSNVASCYFCVGMKTTSSGSIAVAYWYEATMRDETKQTFYETYTSGDETLTFLKGVAILKLKEGIIGGSYRDYEGYIAISTAAGMAIVELNEETKTFTLIEGLVGTYTALADNGSGANNSTLSFKGKDDKATYTEPAAEEGGDPAVHEGTYQGTNEMVPINEEQSAEVYEFVSDDNKIAFKFLLLTTSTGSSVFARYSETYRGEYTEEGGGKLTLDGYGLHAVYEVEGETIDAWRYTVTDNTVTISIEAGLIVFDLGGNNTFTTRGGEAGSYVVVDNQEMKNLYYRLDGYGNLVVYAAADPTDANSEIDYIDEHGTYEREGFTFVFRYKDKEVPMNVTAVSGSITQSGRRYACMIVEHPETVRSYVNENDLSVLVLDGYGNAVKYGSNGSVERGYYILVTETMLYYTNGDLDDYDGSIYVYDVAKGTATGVQFKNLGYYTENLESILFSVYGTMTYDQTSYYYNVDAQNVATIYRKYDPDRDSDKTPNKYGFIAEEFGELKKSGSVEYGGKKYYPTSGFSIMFAREENDKNKYPIPVSVNADLTTNKLNLTQLTFAPTGSGVFGVRGTLVIGEGEERRSLSDGVYVYRTVAEDGSASLYFTVTGNRSIFRFEIEVSYTGDSIEEENHNTFTVKSMRTELVMRSESYMNLYYLFMVYLGMVPADTYGTITVVEEYEESGDPKENGKYVNGAFGANSGMYDVNGEIVTFEKLPFTQDEKDPNLYTVDIHGNGENDTSEYRLRFLLTTGFTVLGSYTYKIVAFTRCQTLEAEGGYKLSLERIIRSDYYTAGAPYMPVLKDADGNTIEIEAEDAWRVGATKLYFIKRVKDAEGTKNVSATYYCITLTEADDGTLEEGETVPGYPPYESFTIVVKEATTHYTANGDFVDLCEESQEVLMIYQYAAAEDEDDIVYLPDSTTYEEGTYKAKISETLEYDVTIGEDGTATLTAVELIPDPAPEESEETDS